MAQETQTRIAGSTVRIWDEAKKELQEVVEAKFRIRKERASEAELASKAVLALCAKEKRKLGIA